MSALKHAAHQRGLDAEQACAAYLTAKGYRLLGTRIRTSGGEIDLVALDGETLVLVEVKARRYRRASLESVTPRKQQRLALAAEALLADKIAGLLETLPPNMRFDVMAVCPGQPILHLEDAWRP